MPGRRMATALCRNERGAIQSRLNASPSPLAAKSRAKRLQEFTAREMHALLVDALVDNELLLTEHLSGLSVTAENAIDHLEAFALCSMQRCRSRHALLQISRQIDIPAKDQRKGERRFAHVWVNEKQLEKAEDVARALLAGQGWTIESVELS